MTKDEAFEKFWNTEIVSAVTGKVDVPMWGDIDRNDTAFIFMAGYNACKEALESQEIGDAEIRQMLNDIEYYQKRVEALEQPAQKPLSGIEVLDLFTELFGVNGTQAYAYFDPVKFARAIEQAHGIV
jgi:hypothetical protein